MKKFISRLFICTYYNSEYNSEDATSHVNIALRMA